MPKIVQFNLPPGGTNVELADNTDSALVITDTAGEQFMKITTTDGAEQLELGVGAGDGGAIENAGLIIREIDGSLPELQICDEMGFISDTDTQMRLKTANTIAFKTGGNEKMVLGPTDVDIKGSTIIQTVTSGASVDVVEVKASGGDTVAKINTTNTNGGELILYRGGTPAIEFDVNGGTFFNNPGLGVDFRVETDNKENAFLIDGSEDSVSVGGGGCGAALTGTFTATNNSATISSGSSTAFTTELHVGSAIQIGSEGIYTVSAIASDTELTLDTVFTGSTGAGKSGTTDSGELFAVKTGDSKTLFAVDAEGALVLNTAGSDSSSNNNIGIGGSNILTNATTGNRLIVIGHSSSDYDFTTADSMIVMGYDAGTKITGSARGVLIGPEAGLEVTTSNNIVCIGQKSGEHAGNDCTYVGRAAGQNTTSANNVAIGSSALSASGNPTNSVAVGKDAGKLATNFASTCVGYRAGQTLTSGQSCTFIGADASAGSTVTSDNQTVLGANAASNGANTVTLGASTVTGLHCAVQTISTLSDSRIKDNVRDSGLGLDFINALRPVKYEKKHPSEYPEEVREARWSDQEYSDVDDDGNPITITRPADTKPDDWQPRTEYGLIAQEVKAAMDSHGGADWQGHTVLPSGMESLGYGNLVTVLVKAVQELSSQNESLIARIEQLEGGS